jgi:hypothetical protein
MHASIALEQTRAKDDSVDWSKFVARTGFAQLTNSVEAALRGMTQSDVSRALERIREKQKTFSRGQEISELPIEQTASVKWPMPQACSRAKRSRSSAQMRASASKPRTLQILQLPRTRSPRFRSQR